MIQYRFNEERDYVSHYVKKLMISLSGYPERAGYEAQWDRVVDEQ